MSALERRLHEYLRAVKMGDRQHAGETATNGHAKPEKPDMLPLGGSPAEQCKSCHVLVAITGEALDQELMALACAVAEQKHTKVVHALYVIEVPRTKPINEELREEREKANQALDAAEQDARKCDIGLDREFLQSRTVGQSLADAAAKQHCTLLIIGQPYNAESDDQFELTDTVEYVLKHAPCRVWVIRGQQPGSESETPAHTAERQPAETR